MLEQQWPCKGPSQPICGHCSAGAWRAVTGRRQHGLGLFMEGLSRARVDPPWVNQEPAHLVFVPNWSGSLFSVAENTLLTGSWSENQGGRSPLDGGRNGADPAEHLACSWKTPPAETEPSPEAPDSDATFQMPPSREPLNKRSREAVLLQSGVRRLCWCHSVRRLVARTWPREGSTVNGALGRRCEETPRPVGAPRPRSSCVWLQRGPQSRTGHTWFKSQPPALGCGFGGSGGQAHVETLGSVHRWPETAVRVRVLLSP